MVIVFAPRRWSLATQVLVLQVLVAAVVVAGGLGAAYLQARSASQEQAGQRVLAVARTIAADPYVVAAATSSAPTPTLQPYAEKVRAATGTDFITIMAPDGTRWTHPDPSRIGQKFVGHTEQALAGGVVLEDYTGTLGPSTRAVVPVWRGGAVGTSVVGLVAVGIRLDAVQSKVAAQVPGLLLAALLAALLAGAGTWLVARHTRRQTAGLSSAELRRMVEYYDAVLHAVREGLLLVDRDGTVLLANDESRRLLGLASDPVGRRVTQLGLQEGVTAALADGGERTDELHVTDARVLVLDQARARWQGRDLGTVATLRDRTDLEALTGELDTARGLADALHAQAHESANRLHTVVSLIELGRADEAVRFATEELMASQQLTDDVVGAVAEPALTALLLGKAAQASERGVDFVVEPGTVVPEGVAPPRDLVTIVGNLVDNALDAVAGAAAPQVRVGARLADGRCTITVSDNGPGLPADQVEQAFTRGWSSKPVEATGGRGLGLALVQQSVARLGGTVEVSAPPGATWTVRLPVAAELAAGRA
ncbi:sensor histidine kinase regulating citrate/malate metabolism [Lapillicoccus jejuensis]|uniref:histidine kinase n=1 Tax=Lapillicoccus jejuensis TaxID=402171 RepID=A0A542DZP6_9MICO|nr:sensor histidine kinase regulating citrate/malate metabolism [Lapillicoccus jejuensis]